MSVGDLVLMEQKQSNRLCKTLKSIKNHSHIWHLYMDCMYTYTYAHIYISAQHIDS